MTMEVKKVPTKCAFSDYGNGEMRECTSECVAYAIMAIPRTRMVFDSVLKTYNVLADREPYHGPFCRRGNFPIGLNSDDITVVGPQKKEESSMDVR